MCDILLCWVCLPVGRGGVGGRFQGSPIENKGCERRRISAFAFWKVRHPVKLAKKSKGPLSCCNKHPLPDRWDLMKSISLPFALWAFLSSVDKIPLRAHTQEFRCKPPTNAARTYPHRFGFNESYQRKQECPPQTDPSTYNHKAYCLGCLHLRAIR